MWAGIPYREIDSLTPKEINKAISVKAEKLKDFYQMMAWLIYNGAQLTAIGINNPKKFPTLENVFPNLFEKQEQQDWWVIKQRVEDYAKKQKSNL